ncbi:hypothetical protein [Pimelobacter simplex]|uniref:hypothetical protein n=1 Tax=Nocardioides simplex TaxID=2045 RepID=UPI003AAAB7A1
MTDPTEPARTVRTDHVTGLTLIGVATGGLAVVLALWARSLGFNGGDPDELAQMGRWAWFLGGTAVLCWIGALLAHAMVEHTRLLLERLERLERLEGIERVDQVAEGEAGSGPAEDLRG